MEITTSFPSLWNTFIRSQENGDEMTSSRFLLGCKTSAKGYILHHRQGQILVGQIPSIWSNTTLDKSFTENTSTDLTQESFDRLLAWLDPNREVAGREYESIRLRLIKGFTAHRCSVPDDLADETINRVARKLPEIIDTYVGDRRPYFYRVAHYVHLEHRRRRIEVVEIADDVPDTPPDDPELEFDCLERCLSCLPAQNREVILRYYQGERKKKIEVRKQLAVALRIELPILRLRAQRIREKLKVCILDCLESSLNASQERRVNNGSIT
jgi:DNA-directed RNA polymerase specialized sigma24 family protein